MAKADTDYREEIFEKLKIILQQYSPPLVCDEDTSAKYNLIGNVPVPYGASKQVIPGMYFATAAITKTKTSLYFFPIYMNGKELSEKIPQLKKALSGKTCFNFSKPEEADETELHLLIKQGIDFYKKQGYVK